MPFVVDLCTRFPPKSVCISPSWFSKSLTEISSHQKSLRHSRKTATMFGEKVRKFQTLLPPPTLWKFLQWVWSAKCSTLQADSVRSLFNSGIRTKERYPYKVINYFLCIYMYCGLLVLSTMYLLVHCDIDLMVCQNKIVCSKYQN